MSSSPPKTQAAAVAARSEGKRHRRPSTGVEHAKRVAWGRKWGAIMSEHAKTYERQGG